MEGSVLAVLIGGGTFLFFSGLGLGYYYGLAQIENKLGGIIDIDMDGSPREIQNLLDEAEDGDLF